MGTKVFEADEEALAIFANLIKKHRQLFKANPRRRLYKFEDSFSYIHPHLAFLWDIDWETQPWEIRAGSDILARIRCATCKEWRVSRTSRLIKTDLCKKCYGQDANFRANRAKSMQKVWQDEQFGVQKRKKIAEANRTDKRRKEQSEFFKELWSSPIYRAKKSEHAARKRSEQQREKLIKKKGKIRLARGDIPISKTHQELSKFIITEDVMLSNFLFSNSRYVIGFKCLLCNAIEKKNVNIFINSPYCDDCYSPLISSGERKIANLLEDKGYYIKRNVRSIIKSPLTNSWLELDIFFPQLNIAIEFNGDYWHSNTFLKNSTGLSSFDYHSMKKELCQEKNIRLLYVWESDWKDNQGVVWETLIQYLNGNVGNIPEIFNKMTGKFDQRLGDIKQ